MWEEGATPGRLPAERLPERQRVYGEQDDVRLTRAMLARARRQLLSRGEVDEAILPVLRRAGVDASRPGFFPFVLAAHMEDEPGHRSARSDRDVRGLLTSSAW